MTFGAEEVVSGWELPALFHSNETLPPTNRMMTATTAAATALAPKKASSPRDAGRNGGSRIMVGSSEREIRGRSVASFSSGANVSSLGAPRAARRLATSAPRRAANGASGGASSIGSPRSTDSPAATRDASGRLSLSAGSRAHFGAKSSALWFRSDALLMDRPPAGFGG